MSKYYKSKLTGEQQDALLDLVAQGGSGGSGGGSWLYLDFSATGMYLSSDILSSLSMQFMLVKVKRSDGIIVIGNVFWIITNIETEHYSSCQIMALGVDESLEFVNGESRVTLGEFYKLMGDPYAQMPRLTKEEFYSL